MDHPATAESITTVNPDAEDLVYGTYEYKNGSDAFQRKLATPPVMIAIISGLPTTPIMALLQ